MNSDQTIMTDNDNRPILIFDSGLGGLTVLRHIIEYLPNSNIVYCIDNGGFSYGTWEEGALAARIVSLVGRLIEKINPSVVVIACNTATTVALNALRAAFSDEGPRIPIVGTVPAIKVAAKLSGSRMFSVLATPGTVRREYTKALITVFAGNCDVTLVGIGELAAIAEDKMHGEVVDIPHLSELIQSAFIEKNGKRTDTIVLGCTHYPLLEAELAEAAPWPVNFVDPGPAIARRVVDVLSGGHEGAGGAETREIIFTAPGSNIADLVDIELYGFTGQSILPFPK